MKKEFSMKNKATIIWMTIIGSLLYLLAPLAALAQTDSLGIVEFTPPKGWIKSAKDNVVIFRDIRQSSGHFCFLTLYGATPSTGVPQKDFVREWNNLVVQPWSAEANPKTETIPDNGWTAIAAGAPIDFQGNKAFAFLTVISGFGKTITVLGILNDDSYLAPLQAFVEGMNIDKAAVAGTAQTHEEMRPAASANAGPTMNVNALAKEFQDNEVRANQTWIGKRVRVTGTVNTIKIVANGSIELTFKTSITNYNMARCTFDKSQSAGVATLTAHTEGTVEGTVRGLGGGFDNSKTYFLLENCSVP
jgi:hypothetical protein